ncbi:hypothetical protein [Actinoallomurus iriomotensis]|uniref:Uncharacterized protein n=1 Tax=Actinoallomurus iriomotensis TaxID=478107 RepID=A0A9W6RMP2_9ACTN|nr:hypothetical protein [Actinoallomurus iriomotensis]GLY76827.1 hypothetical protein Airi01_050940 [Actinoallomurus iriomotensis]
MSTEYEVIDPRAARQAYKELAAEAGRLLHAADDARRRLAEAEEERTATYASVEQEWAHLDALEERAAGVWRELTNRFGPHAAGPLPEPAERIARGPDAEELLNDARLRVRQPVDHPLAGRYARMGVLGFAVAVVLTLVGLEVSMALHDAGRVRWFAAGLPALLAPWLGHLAANGWIRYRTSHEEQEYAVDTAIAGAIGGGAVWLFAVTFLIIRVAT